MRRRFETLEPIRTRIRRAQLIVGLGFLAYVLGSVLSAFLFAAAGGVLDAIPWPWLTGVIGGVVSQLWAWGFLPFFCFISARAFGVGPLSAPIGMLCTGLFFVFMLGFITEGSEGLLALPGYWWGSRLVLWGVAIWLGRAAVHQGQRATARAEARAKKKADENAAQYAAIVEESERLASRSEQRAATTTKGAITQEPSVSRHTEPLPSPPITANEESSTTPKTPSQPGWRDDEQ